jgi:hypothetical protein
MMPSETQIQPGEESSSRNVIFCLLCLSFVLNGVIITFIGPLLTVFRIKWGLDDGRAGLFSTMQFSFSLAGVLVSSALVTAKGFKPAITLGLAMLESVLRFSMRRRFPGARRERHLWFGIRIVHARDKSLGRRIVRGTSCFGPEYHEPCMGSQAGASAPLAKVTIQTSTVTTLLYSAGGLALSGRCLSPDALRTIASRTNSRPTTQTPRLRALR